MAAAPKKTDLIVPWNVVEAICNRQWIILLTIGLLFFGSISFHIYHRAEARGGNLTYSTNMISFAHCKISLEVDKELGRPVNILNMKLLRSTKNDRVKLE